MQRRTRGDVRQQANTLYHELREMDFLAYLLDQTLMTQCEWAVEQGLDRISFLRVVYYAGCQFILSLPPQTTGLIAAARGAEMSQDGMPDDLPF